MTEVPLKRYRSVSKLFLLLGTVIAVLTSLILYFRGTTIEAWAQILFIPIIAGAIYYGKKGGLAAALAAGIVYVLLIMYMVKSQLAQIVTLSISLRVIFFIFMGLVGGLLFEKFKEEVRDLEEKVLVDKETGLHTTRYFITVIQQEVDRAKRYKSGFSLIIFQLDEEKIKLSKRAEKKLAKELGQMLKQQTRIVDEIAYLNHGDFGVVLPEINKEGADFFLKRVKEKFVEVVKKSKRDFSDKDLYVKAFNSWDDIPEIEEMIGQYGEEMGISYIKRPKELV
ncbi:MAG TPA: diguanylate cyclase [Actinobacteria bacterium]|nr:diguanylate cyclase [Actinomycetota bacterium]